MDKRKIISILLCTAIVAGAFAACAVQQTAGEATSGNTVTVVQTVTDQNGEAVTVADGEVVTETVTEVVSEAESSTAEAQSTTAAESISVEHNGTSKAATKQTSKKKKKRKKKEITTEPEINYIDIVLQKNGKASCSSPNVSLSSGEVIIEKAGDYRITQKTDGSEWHGQIIVKLANTEKAELRFENVKINYNKNAIQLIDKSIKANRSFLESESETAADEIKEVSEFDQAPNVQLSFPEGTSSTFVSTANSVTGVLYNESKLTIKGHGKAVFESKQNANNCICSTKSLKIRNINLNLITAQNNNTSTMASNTGGAKGIYSYSKVTLESGSLNITTNGDAIRCDEFIAEGGSASIKSSACDGIDADDAIVINGGSINVTALEKYCFKVRRINNTEKGASGGVRSGKGDTFAVNAGVVRGEGKKITTVQGASKQPSITCKIVKPSRGTEAAAEESKVPAVIEIKNVKKSTNKCTKFLYSDSGITKNKEYTATANGNSGKISWKGSVGIIDIESTKNR